MNIRWPAHLEEQWAILEVDEKGQVTGKGAEDYSIMTNFYQNRAKDHEIRCPRFLIAQQEIVENLETFNLENALDILEKTRQATTKVSLEWQNYSILPAKDLST